jgi:hypothetical protein
MPVHDVRVFRPVPDALAKHRGGDPLGRPFEELAGKTAADAVAHIEELADAEVVHQPELVVGESVPGVGDRHRAGGLAAIGVALVHRDAMEIVLERLHRVEHGGRPVADARVQAPAGGDQQREAGAGLLIADADVAFFVERHGRVGLAQCDIARLGAEIRVSDATINRGLTGSRLQERDCTIGIAISRRRFAWCLARAIVPARSTSMPVVRQSSTEI